LIKQESVTSGFIIELKVWKINCKVVKSMEIIIYNQGENASSDFDQMHNMMKASIFISSAFIKKIHNNILKYNII
jgi:hypothetical protein